VRKALAGSVYIGRKTRGEASKKATLREALMYLFDNEHTGHTAKRKEAKREENKKGQTRFWGGLLNKKMWNLRCIQKLGGKKNVWEGGGS